MHVQIHMHIILELIERNSNYIFYCASFSYAYSEVQQFLYIYDRVFLKEKLSYYICQVLYNMSQVLSLLNCSRFLLSMLSVINSPKKWCKYLMNMAHPIWHTFRTRIQYCTFSTVINQPLSLYLKE